MQTDSRNHTDPLWATDAERRAQAQQTLWTMLGTLWRRRKLVAGVTGGAAVLAVVISLLLPNWYRAETRLLLPTSSGSNLLSGALGNISSTARSVLGGVTGDYQRYLSILDSRTVKENVIQRFDLIAVYDIEDGDEAMQAAIETLEGNLDFVVDEEYNHLSVQVYDQDPQRAADMANYFVEELNRINAELASQSAANFRRYVEHRYEETETELDSVLKATSQLQERYGVLNLETQGELFYTGVTELRLNALQLQIEYERLLSEYGPENSAVQAARQVARAANRQYNAAMEGQERMLPVPKDSLPAVARQLIALQQQQLTLAKVLEYTRPVLEEARLEEQRKVEAVQVVDVARPPSKKARPFRALIVIASTLSAFLLVALYVLLLAWWRRHHAEIARRLAAASDEPKPTAASPPRTPASP